VFRLAVGLPPAVYEQMFGPRPARPPKGGVVLADDDFTATDVLMPHPVYAWMGWVQVLSPSAETFAEMQPLLAEAYELAVRKYDVSIAKRERS
jgi:putative intracellular protease/amidase